MAGVVILAGLVGFSLDPQGESNWCWVTVTRGVDQFLNGKCPAPAVLAAKVLGATCHVPNDNCVADIGIALTDVKIDNQRVGDKMDFDSLKQNIQNNVPVCIEIKWSAGPSQFHYAAITACGTKNGVKMVRVTDQNAAGSMNRWISYNDFINTFNYPVSRPAGVPGGKWVDTTTVAK